MTPNFQNQPISDGFSASREIEQKHVDFQNDLALEVNIGAAARLARVTHDDIHHAMVSGDLAWGRDADSRRVVRLGDLLSWMRARCPAQAE